MQQSKIKIYCPVCGEKIKEMKVGDKDQGGEIKCKWCDEKIAMPKILVLSPVKETPPESNED
jgi:transcription elongation factor Elf1